MKIFLCIFCSMFLLGCENSSGKQKDENMMKFYDRSLMENLQKSPQEELFSLHYEVVQLEIKDHHQSIVREDSKALFKLKVDRPNLQGNENLGKILFFFDKYNFFDLRIKKSKILKGQEWELTFNKNKELVKLKLLKKVKVQGGK